jgi:dienelactone hydrolase
MRLWPKGCLRVEIRGSGQFVGVRGLRWPACGLAVLLALLCAGCSSGSAAPQHVALDAGPAAAAFDTPVDITISGLPPGGAVTVQAQTRDAQGRRWDSQAQFRATAAGTLNLATAVPVSGSYHVADANGLLWSLHPAYTTNPAATYSAEPPGFTVTVQALTGGHVEATATLRREVTPPASVQTVRQDGFASALFAPPQARPGAPAIVVIGGAEGGEQTELADGLAVAGYPALAVGYFKEPGLPQCLCRISLGYFARAVGWLRAQPVARGRPVVLIGDSAGAEAVLLIASYEPHLADAIVANSPSYLITAPPGIPAWTFDGRPLTTGALIPAAGIRIPVLLSDGGQDLVWPSGPSATQIVQELRRSADPAPYANLYYPAAGHTTAGLPPDIPMPTILYGAPRGGSEQADALAAEQFWPSMIKFLNNPAAPLK